MTRAKRWSCRVPHPLPKSEDLPDLAGGTNWFSPSFSLSAPTSFLWPRGIGRNLPERQRGVQAGRSFNGGGQGPIVGEPPIGVIRALNPDTGELKWEFKLHSVPMPGVLSTAGNLAFTGTNEGDFFALRRPYGAARFGNFQTGASITAIR